MKLHLKVIFVFCCCCLLTFLLSDSLSIIKLRPQSVHAWRQADCVSYTLNYYQNNQSFFEPQTHTLVGKNGHAASEFPLLYFVTARFYKWFGVHEWFLRALNFLIFFVGCFCLLFIGFQFFTNKWLSLVPALFTFTSPFLYYYGLNFLPDVPALSLALMGSLFAFKYVQNKNLAMWYVAVVVFSLAMLIKISAGISFFAFAGAIGIQQFYARQSVIPPKHYKHIFTGAIIIVALNICWIAFVVNYNKQSGSQQNLTGIYPIWDEQVRVILYICKRTLLYWSLAVLNPLFWLLLVVGFFLLVRKMQAGLLRTFIWLNIVGAVLYSLLWFRAYQHHDYYMINPFVALIWIAFGVCCVIDFVPLRRLYLNTGMGLLFFLAILYCRKVQTDRYYHFNGEAISADYYTVEPYLRSIGISRKDIVVSVPDKTPNLTLYLLNQPG